MSIYDDIDKDFKSYLAEQSQNQGLLKTPQATSNDYDSMYERMNREMEQMGYRKLNNKGLFGTLGDIATGINATRKLTEQQRDADDLLWDYHYNKNLSDKERQDIKAQYDNKQKEIKKNSLAIQKAKGDLQYSGTTLGDIGSHALSAGSSLESMQEQYKYNVLGAAAGGLLGALLPVPGGAAGGAMAGWKLANVPSALLVNYRDAEAGAMEAWHDTLDATGDTELARQAYYDALKPNLAYAGFAAIPDIALGGGVGKTVVNTGKKVAGKVLGKEFAKEAAEEAAKAAGKAEAAKGIGGTLRNAADKIINFDMGDKAGAWVAGKTGVPLLGKAAKAGIKGGAEVVSEIGQEAEQGISGDAATATALHQYDPIDNPDVGGWSVRRAKEWLQSEEGKETMLDTAVSTLLTGGAAATIGAAGDKSVYKIANKIADKQQADAIKKLANGEPLTEAEQQSVNNLRNMAGNNGNPPNNPPPPPGTAAAAEEMMQRNGTPSFEYTRGTRWELNNDSVNVDNLQDITKAGVGDISTVFYEMTGQPLIITSGTDGAGALHMDGTYSHGTGYKIDVSGNGLDDPDLRHAFIEYCESKGITVLDEYEHPSPNSTGGHLDLEFHGYNGAGSVDDYSGPVNQVMPDMEAEPASNTDAGMMASDLTGQSFLEEDNGPLFADDTAKAQRDSELENRTTEELQYMMNDAERAEYEAESAKIMQNADVKTPTSVPRNLTQIMQQQRNAALDILRRRKVGTAIPVNRSNNISYPTHRQQQTTAQTRNTATPYSRQSQDNLRTRVAGMDDAALADAYRNAKDIPSRQIVVDELQKRIDNANNAARQPGAQQEAATTPMLPKQETGNAQQQQNDGPSLTATRVARSGQVQQETNTNKGRYDAQEEKRIVNAYADNYQDNPDAWRNEIATAKRNVDTALANGEISKEQAEQSKANINSLYFKVQGELDRRKESRPQPKQVAQQSNVQSGTPSMDDVLARARKAGIKDNDLPDMLDTTIRAAMGDQRAKKRHDGWKPEVKQALSDILSGNIERTNRTANEQQNTPIQAQSAQNQSEERRSENGQAKLQKPETGENRNQNQNAESGQGKQGKDTHGETAEKQSENIKQEEPKPKKAEPPKNETREEKAERLINEAFEDEDERDMAMSCFFDNMENPLQALEKKRKEKQEQLDTLVENAYEALARTLPKDKNGKPTGAGVDLIRKADDTGYIRDSKNPLWYRNDYADGVKMPYSKKNMMNTALEMVLGERKDMADQEALMEYDATNKQLEEMFNDNRQLYDEIEILNSIEPKLKAIQKELDGGKRETKTAKPANETKKAEPKPEAKEIPAKKDINGYKNEIQDAVKSMTFTQEKADELLKEYNNLLDNMVARNEITKAEAEVIRYSMEGAVKRGLILNDGRKLLSPKVREWLDNHPFSYDKSKSREENIAAAQKLKEDFIKETGIYSTNDGEVTPERVELRKRIVDYLYNVGSEKRRRERKATLAIGYPAAGKSTVTKDLTDNKGYLLIDADEAKKLLPEFHGGALADIVHDESSDLSKTLFDIALDEGDNLCWPTIGGKYESLKKKISKLHNEGLKDEKTGKIVKRVDKSGKVLPPYEVTLSYVDVPADEALKRIYNRFEETGRFDNPQNIHNLMLQTPEGNVTIQLPEGKRKERLGPTETVAIDNMILKNYLAIKEEKGVEKYEWIDNNELSVDAPIGEKLREAGRLSGGSDGRHIPGTGEGGSGIRSGDNGRESSETQEVNNTNTETDSTQDEGAISLPENETETPVTEAEVPETLRGKSAVPKEKIEDFGQKIGGARKDMYVDIGTDEKPARKKTERKPDDGLKDRKWLRDYDIKQGEDGKWTVTHKESEDARKRQSSLSTWIMGLGIGKKRAVEKRSFDSKEEAEKAAAIDAVVEKHRLFKRGSEENAGYYLARKIGGKQKGHWFTLKEGFKTQAEAMEYMVTHAEEILNIRTSFGESDLPRPNIVGWNDARNGKAPQRLKENQNATPEMFTDKFGFRGVQFGIWENPVERQAVLNAAYEGLLDLADIVGVDPKILSLNGELGLAFGARGQGLSGAVAHYEPGYTVINITKMKGAGALAHEWFHALDHYLMIKGGIISNERRGDGRLTAKNQNTHASDSDYQLKRSGLSQSLKDAFQKLKNTAFYKEVVETKDETDAAKWEQQSKERLDNELNNLRNYLAKDRQYSSKKKAATEEQLKRFDELATKLAAADEKQEWDPNYQLHVFPTMRKMSELVKEVTGRSLLKKNPNDDYTRLNYAIRMLQIRRKTLADAQAKTEFINQVPSEYSRNNTTIDRGRSTEYWTKPTEMLARAFSSYVEDSAKAKGYSTDFLSYGSDNRLVMFGKPFPEGEERKALNKAFGDFFKEVQKEVSQNKKETGKIRFSIRAAAKEKMTGDEKYQAAYHGSPHVFDTFSVDHIGSGEGAQFHGWGLYFAQDRNVAAERYRDRLVNRGDITEAVIDGEKYSIYKDDDFDPYATGEDALWMTEDGELLARSDAIAINYLTDAGFDLKLAKQWLQEQIAESLEVDEQQDAFDYQNAISFLDSIETPEEKLKSDNLKKGGSLFEVDIPENNALLDENNSYEHQPAKVKTALKNILQNMTDEQLNSILSGNDVDQLGHDNAVKKILREYNLFENNGRFIYEDLVSAFGSPRAASEALNKAGVKGITYEGGIDGRCFVIFDDAAIQIMQRYESAVRVHGEEIKRSVDAIVNEVKDAYPGAKNFKVEGNNISFTMPNGVNLQVNIKDQIIVDGRDAEKARADHGLTDPDTDIVVEGYTRKLDNGDFIALSQESSEGTAYHEAMHTVRDWVLTDKENRDLETYYKKIADKQGIDVEEAIADGYRDWKLARAKGSGTLFGKLYKKIMDFIDTVRAIFKGMYDVHKIYEQIESGDVWNRDARGRFTGGYNENYIKFQAAMSKRNAPKTIEEFDKAIREADKPSKIGFWFTTSKGAEITIPGSNYKHIQDGDHPLTIKQWKAVIENLENADYAEKDNVVGPNGGVPVQIKIDTPLGKAGVSLEVLPNGHILVDTAVFNNDAAIDNWIKNKKSSQTLGIEPNGKQDRILGRLSLFDIIRDKLGIVNKFKYSVQEYSSADTSLNQIPSIFKRVQWQQGTTNIDIGGGRFNTATDYMKEQGVNNIVFDPFNRDTEHNRNAFDKIKAKGDTVTVANVLNVIKEGEIRDNVILQAAKALKPDGTAYFGIYEGDKSGTGRATSKGWQNNRKANEYIAEIAKHFEDVSRKGNMIVATNPIVKPGEKATWSMDTNPENDIRYSIREKVTEAVNPEPPKYGNDNTGLGKVTQVVSDHQEKSKVQKAIDFVKNFYFEMVDEENSAHKVDEEAEKRTGKKLADHEKFYDKVRMAPAIAKGHAEKLIAGDEKHGEVVKSRIKNETLKKQFNAKATLKNVIDTVADDVMNSKYGDFLKKHNMRDWTQVLNSYLAAHRLKEMYGIHLQEWADEHAAWKKRKEEAQARGETFRAKEPKYTPYKLPGGLTIADLNACIKNCPPEMEQAAQLYYAFNKNLTIILADAGLICGENYQAMNNKYKRYCPLMRDFSDTAAADSFIEGLTRGGKGVVNVSNPLKRISEEGSSRKLLSPLENSIRACAIYCDRAERNKVGQMAVDTAAKYKLDDMIWRAKGTTADAKNCIFTVMQDGKKVAYQCLPELYGPIVGYNESDMGSFLTMATIPARVLRAGATLSPTFAIRNAIRDTFFAGISSTNGFIPIYDTVRGAYALYTKPEMRAKFEAMGVNMYSFYGNEMASGAKLDDLKQFKPPEDALGIIKKWLWDKPMAKLEWVSENSEKWTRMGEFQRALEKGKSLEEAARDARNVTVDFSRHGHTGKVINRYVPFFNACIQGGDLMVRLLKQDPVGTMAKLAKYIVAPSILSWLLNHDKDWWKELDPDIKNAYWFLETPAGILRFPKPQEAGVVFGSFFEALLDTAYKKDPDAIGNWAKSAIDVALPGLQFTLITPLLENAANYSWFRKNQIVGMKNQRLPGEMQYTSGTSELSKMIGGSAPVKAIVKGGYSPSKIDNLVRGYTGTLGIIAWQAAGEGVRKAQGQDSNSPAKKWQEMPFAREFFANDYNMNRSLNEFYEMATAAQAQHNGYGRKGHPTAAVKAVTKARNAIADERKEIQKITDSKRITPERKQELIKMKRDKINRIATATLNRYRDKF